ncbi:hypothetical protein BDF21DRAFT_465617 [Thamnidium elegans]|nr:hypothetical protein BDF21DRAFT_465617 [Thamnidium elegans]
MHPLSTRTFFELSELNLEHPSNFNWNKLHSGNVTNEAMDFAIGGDPYDSNKQTDFVEYLKNKLLDVENNSREAGSSKDVKDTSSDKEEKYVLHDGTARRLFLILEVAKRPICS